MGPGGLLDRFVVDFGVDLRSLGVILDVLGASLLEVDFKRILGEPQTGSNFPFGG